MTSGSDQGRIIGGKYHLVELAGEGGMATVWRGIMYGAAGFSRTVAVKKMKPEFRAVKNYIAMFVEEARVGSELQHPNIVQVLDLCVDEDNYFYLVMEWIDGLDLGSYVRSYADSGLATPWPLIVASGIGVLRGLAAAHERVRPDGTPAPVIHRDVSPHNILLALNGVVKLTDFGLALARDRIYRLTAPGTVKGKLSYLAPELTMGQPATTMTDLFAVGSVLWEALATRRLFEGATDLEVFEKIRNAEVAPLASTRSDLPPRLVAAIHRALASTVAGRYASARDMAQELAGILASVPLPTDAQTLLGRSVAVARKQLGMGPPRMMTKSPISLSALPGGDGPVGPGGEGGSGPILLTKPKKK
jgi:serine/threonine-protein kinase